jgi:peroxiredoxin
MGCTDHASSNSSAEEPSTVSRTPGTTEAPAESTVPDTSGEISTSLGPAPDFERTTLSGNAVRRADWEGRVVVLNFWATWCAPCREEIPHLIDLQREYSPEEVRVAGVSIDEEGASVVRPYAEEMDISYPLILDPERTLAEKYGGHYAVPTTFIIDPNGNIRQRYMRAVEKEDLRPVIESLLKG